MANHTENAFAFFDVDDTIIADKSMFSFMDLYFEIFPEQINQQQFRKEIAELIKANTPWEIANKIYYSYFKGLKVNDVKRVCEIWFERQSKNKALFYHTNIVNQLLEHQAEGVIPVFVSGSFVELLKPIADYLHVEHILAINIEQENAVYTGNIVPPQTIGQGKAEAVRTFLSTRGVNSTLCFAYGDDISDLPMLQSVGNPIAVSGGRGLQAYAEEAGWRVMQPY